MKEHISNLRSLKNRRISLRRNSTPQERMLWSRIRGNQLGYKFRRQHSFGNYIADFYCPEKNLIIEIDGSQHTEQEQYDTKRTAYFESMGLRVVRFWNNEINTNLEGVLMRILKMLE